jgi:hypothetical protein
MKMTRVRLTPGGTHCTSPRAWNESKGLWPDDSGTKMYFDRSVGGLF